MKADQTVPGAQLMKFATALSFAAMAAIIPQIAEAQTMVTGPVITGTRLEVTARGESHVVPDVAVISAGVVSQAADAATAMRENADRMARVIASLKTSGIAARDMSTASISLAPQYRYQENQLPVITGYQASNQLTVRFRDIAKSGTILDTLVKQGANQINGPNLMLDKPEAAQDAARVEAIKSARSRADLYAKAAGLTVKRIVSISESNDDGGRPVPMVAMAMARDASAKTEVLPGEQAIGVSVAVIFELQ
jgi:uncharacterized protein